MDDSTTAAGAFCRWTRRRGPSHKHTRRRRRRRHGMKLSAGALCRGTSWWSWSSHNNHTRCPRRRLRFRGMDFAAAALCRGASRRRRGLSRRHNQAGYRRHRRRSGGTDMSAAALPRRAAGAPFRGRSGLQQLGRRHIHIHIQFPRRTRQTDGRRRRSAIVHDAQAGTRSAATAAGLRERASWR